MTVPRDQILGAVDTYANRPGRLLQLQQLARQGRMDDLKYQQAQQGVADDQAVRNAFSSSVNPDGSMDRAKILQSLASQGQGMAAQKLSGAWAEQDAKLEEARAQAAAAVSKMTVAQREEAQKRTTAVGKASKWVLGLPAEQQQQGFDLAAETLGMPNLKGRPVNQKELQLWAASSDIFQEALDPYKERDFALREKTLDETSRHNRAMESKPSGSTLVMGGGGGLSPDALDMMADQYRKTGALPNAGMGAAGTTLRIKIANRAAELDKIEGVNTDLAESKMKFKTAQEARDYFTKGKGADAFRQQETIIHHADAFTQIADKLNNGDVQGANKLGNALGVQFGSDKATNYKIVGQILSSEVGKYLAGTMSTEAERKELAELIPSFSSPEQIKGGLATLKALVEGQRQSWTVQRDAALKGQVPIYQGEIQAPQAKPAGKWAPTQPSGKPDTSTIGKNPRFPDAVWVGSGAPSGGGWYHKNADGTVTRVE